MDLSCSINHPGIKLGRPHISLHCWTGHVRARLVRATNCQFKYRTFKQVQKCTCLADDNITTTKFSFQHFEEKSTELSFCTKEAIAPLPVKILHPSAVKVVKIYTKSHVSYVRVL
jgi:hypothetical protein